MKTVIINALNSNSGGGKSIRDSLIRLLDSAHLDHRYLIFVAHDADLTPISNPNIEVLRLPALLSKKALAPLAYRVLLGRYIKQCRGSLVLNLGDVIIRTRTPQIYVLDWPYVLDVHEKVWTGLSPRDRIIVWFKLLLHRLCFNEPAVVIAQTDEIRLMLLHRFGLEDVRVIGNAPTLTGDAGCEDFDAPLPAGVRFIYPSMYYPHKNLEVLLDVAQEIKDRGLNYRIIITVTPNSPASARFVAAISDRRLQGVLVNVGRVPLEQMQGLYKRCDAIVMPSLLESYSIVYPEAMANGLPIVTSDLWFARAVCGDAAYYCNPDDALDILHSMEAVMATPAVRNKLVNAGKKRLKSQPSWENNFASYQKIIQELIK